MFKLTIVLVAVAIASVACNPVREDSPEKKLAQAKAECARSVNRAISELADQYRALPFDELSDEKHDELFDVYSKAVYEMNALSRAAREAESMEVVEGVKTAYGMEVHCNKAIADEVASVSHRFSESWKKLLS